MKKVGNVRRYQLVSIVFALGIGFVAEAATLVDPAPAQWGCELSEDKVLHGINGGLIGRGWVVTKNDGAGHLVAQVVVRGKHTLVVTVDFTASFFDINYKDSDNLRYRKRSDGSAKIHRNANSWMNNIQKDIVRQLSSLCNL